MTETSSAGAADETERRHREFARFYHDNFGKVCGYIRSLSAAVDADALANEAMAATFKKRASLAGEPRAKRTSPARNPPEPAPTGSEPPLVGPSVDHIVDRGHIVLDWLFSRVPGTRARRRYAATTDKVTSLGRALCQPITDATMMNLAIARITGRTTENRLDREARATGAGAVSMSETARAWAQVLSSGSCVPFSPSQLHEMLLGFAQQLAQTSVAQRPQVASRVGRDLGQRLRITPEAFEDLLEVLIPWLERRHPEGDPTGFPVRIKALAALTGGFATGVRNRVLDEQIAMDSTLAAMRQQDLEHALAEPLRFTAMMAASDRPMALLDRGGTLLRTNAAARGLLAVNAGERGVMLEDCAYTEPDCLTIRTLIDDILDAGTVHFEFAVAWPEGTFKSWARATLRWYRGTHEDHGRICAVFVDATPHYAWRRQLDHLANTDDATELPHGAASSTTPRAHSTRPPPSG